MDILEIRDCLESMVVLVDSREHLSRRAEKRYEAFGVPYERRTLDYGDYAYDFTLPSGKRFYGGENGARVYPDVVVERKMSLDEAASCFATQRERFKREFERARANGARVYLLIENATPEGIINGRYRSRLHPNAFLASLMAWLARYDMRLIMCKSDTSGRMIKEILYRELKERLEDGRIKCEESGRQEDTHPEEKPEDKHQRSDKD